MVNPEEGGSSKLQIKGGGGAHHAPHVKIALQTVFAKFVHTTHQIYIQ